ncbi:uncharacterized protein LOC141877960 isoform X2 [Acropora palmata]|uniref:uncharacterized protein LOC141877960 isoform X2 n=1 Tax=Acropora palmata TaxID=6131 RepID=UPI003DA05D0C
MTSKKKSSRFTEQMNAVLIDSYSKHQVVLKSKFTNHITNEKKKSIWENITLAVNAVNSGERKTVEQVKKRWEDITMQVKRKERTARHNEINRLKITGNGKLPDDQEESEVITIPVTQSLASSPERKVAQILGPEVFEGISGGLDTLDTSGWLDRQPQFSTSTASMVAGADGMASVDLDADVKQLDQPQNLKEMTSKSIKGRKRSLADAQIGYFEVCTSYYKLKMEKVCLEMKALQGHKEE